LTDLVIIFTGNFNNVKVNLLQAHKSHTHSTAVYRNIN